MSKNKNKHKHRKGRVSKHNAPTQNQIENEIDGLIREHITDALGDQVVEIENIIERIREGDASPNEIDEVLQNVVEEIGVIIDNAERIDSDFIEAMKVCVDRRIRAKS